MIVVLLLTPVPGDAAGGSERAHGEHVVSTITRFPERDWEAVERAEPMPGPGWARDEPAERGRRGGGRGRTADLAGSSPKKRLASY